MNEEYIAMFEQLLEELKTGCTQIAGLQIDHPQIDITEFGDDERKFKSMPRTMNIQIVGTPKHEDDLLA